MHPSVERVLSPRDGSASGAWPAGGLRAGPSGTGRRPAGRGRAAVLSLALSMCALAACDAVERTRSAPEPRGLLLTEPVERPDFTLADTKGRPFRFAQETAGFLTFLFFGYTNCPDICPVHMANLGTVLDRFPADLRRRVRVVFVTTDPERDTPERIDAWLRPFGPAFVGLTGSLEEVNRIQAGLGLPVADRADAAADGGYAVGHSALVLAFPPGRPATWAYPFGTRQEDWLLEIPRLLKEGS